MSVEAVVPWWSVLPFAALLACIAILPLLPATAHLWEQRRYQLAIALGLGGPVAGWMWQLIGPSVVWHALFEYAQFITLLFALFAVAGGIFLAGDLRATPRTNTLLIAVGAIVASIVGTTGAAMLLIRPLLRTNSERLHKGHTVLFFIFVVANCGGLLTPLGDPPLFLGFLRGVPFTWTLTLLPEWAFVNGLLLVSFYATDRVAYSREDAAHVAWDAESVEPLTLHGTINFAFLGVIIASVLAVPSLDLHAVESGSGPWWAFVPWRELAMLGATAASMLLGDKGARYDGNEFHFGPIAEVAALFLGIFLTMIPALRYLAQVAPSLRLGEVSFFLLSGGLSSVLDNAPTYATFFEMAKALAPGMPGATLVAGVPEQYLVAISTGSVFCGAITYIGNGPNFMVKAVAEHSGVPMPSFGGYVLRSFTYLVPVLGAMMCLFIASSIWLTAVGVVLTLAILGRAALSIRGLPAPR